MKGGKVMGFRGRSSFFQYLLLLDKGTIHNFCFL